MFLSCGPIVEPLIGIACASVICIGIAIFSIIKFVKSEKYKRIKLQSLSEQLLNFLLLIMKGSLVMVVLWFVLFFLFAGIAFGMMK